MRLLAIVLAALLASTGLCSALALPAQTPQCPFSRGFNLGGWFQDKSASELSNVYTVTDLENMMALGADHIRVPIDFGDMSFGGPGYAIDPILFMYLDRLVDWAETLGLYIILDYHPHATLADDPQRKQRLIAFWQQVAERYKARSNRVLYELHNEPYGLSDYEWGRLQGQVMDTIRAIDATRTLLVSPNAMSHFESLEALPWYADTRLIYTFHFYDPFLFTHQGTNWTDPSMESLTGVPYPYNAARMPPMPAAFRGTWLGQQWDWYADSATRATFQRRMDIAARFADARKVPIHCGEFGVWAPAAPQADRVRWYADIRSFLESDGIPWTMWGYKGGFGIYKQNTPGRFPDDLDTAVAQALGLSVPSSLAIQPDISDMAIYDDLVGDYFFDGGHSGTLDLHDASDPAEGAQCLRWTGASRYSAIAWCFTNPRDLSQLKNGDYRLRFRIKTDSPGLRFDIRFLDTDLDDGRDHPWRMVKTVDSSLVPMDGQWHELEIALRDMSDVGAWDDGTWYGSQGSFDWTRVDRIEIVAEHQAIQGISLWLDDIRIVAPPAARATGSNLPPGVLLANGDFASGMAHWGTYTRVSSGVAAQFVIHSGALNAYFLGETADPWSVQLMQQGIPLVQGAAYVVEFAAWADADRSMLVALTRVGASSDSYASQTFEVTTTPTSYRFAFVMTEPADPAARFVVAMGASNVTLRLAGLSLEKE